MAKVGEGVVDCYPRSPLPCFVSIGNREFMFGRLRPLSATTLSYRGAPTRKKPPELLRRVNQHRLSSPPPPNPSPTQLAHRLFSPPLGRTESI
jgi:hypothetical protein